MAVTRVLALLCACLLLGGCPKPKAAVKTLTASVPGPPGSVLMTGAHERAKQWIRSGGADSAVVLPNAPQALAEFSMTTDLKGRAVASVKLAGAVSRGPGRVAGIETFAMHDGKGGTFTDVATYEVTFQVGFKGGGGTEEVTTSLYPRDGRWYVLAPAAAK